MDLAAIEQTISSIMWGCHIAQVLNGLGQNVIIIFHPASIEDKNYASFLYNMELENAIKYGISCEKNILTLARKNGQWTEYEDNYINKFDEIMEYSRKKKAEAFSVVEKNSIDRQMKSAEKRRVEIQKKYNDILGKSAESIAREAVATYMISRTAYNLKGKLLFENIDEITDELFLWNTLRSYLEANTPKEGSLIRSIARSPQWRIRWNVGKTNLSQLFGTDIRGLSDTQLHLVYWSQVYDSAYQSLDCPPDDTINDDEKFDDWLNEQHEKYAIDKANRQLDNKTKNSGNHVGTSVEDHHEMGISVHGYYDKDGYYREYTPAEKRRKIEQIQSKNSNLTRRILATEQDKIETSGMISDGKLRNQKTMMMLGVPLTKGK